MFFAPHLFPGTSLGLGACSIREDLLPVRLPSSLHRALSTFLNTMSEGIHVMIFNFIATTRGNANYNGINIPLRQPKNLIPALLLNGGPPVPPPLHMFL